MKVEQPQTAHGKEHRGGPLYAESACLHDLIQNQARLTPGSEALQFQNRHLTYAELNDRSTQFANYLRNQGVGPGCLVGVCVDRSFELWIALIGILKAGASYLPLDPSFPAERISYMLRDSGVAVLLTFCQQMDWVGEYAGRVIDIERHMVKIVAESIQAPHTSVSPGDPAYVIYTSGSTGKPKGVMISHGALVNLMRSMLKEPGITEADTLLAISTYSFDIAVPELYLPLIAGGRIVIADRDMVIDGRKLAAELEVRGITLMQATPTTWRMLIAAGWNGDKKLKALCGGESMSRDLAEDLLMRAGSVWNLYGPTETTVWSVMTRVYSGEGPVPIGLPVANTTLYILDESGRPAPTGTIGKLYIGGNGLAIGYRNRPDLTAQKFVNNPIPGCRGERIYDTGDLARYRSDGLLEWHGRLDSQVKIQGYRIELEEIESVLRQHTSIQDAVVVTQAKGADDKKLVAYIVPVKHDRPSSSEVKQHCQRLLPAYMVPVLIVAIETLPRTVNGKLDRDALIADRTTGGHSLTGNRRTPTKPLEVVLLRLFEDLLHVGPICTTDSFLELGGNSLLAAQLVVRIEEETGHLVPPATLFQASTVEQLALKLETRTYTDAWSRLVELRQGGGSTTEPLFCIHWLDAKLVTFYRIASRLRDDRPVYGLQPGGPAEREADPKTIAEMAAIYLREIRALHPKGPYHLAGSCLGGVVAFEIAQQLIAAGERVGLLLLIDAYMPGPLEYLHDRPYMITLLDGYFGELLLSPADALKRWVREIASRFAARFRRSTSLTKSRNYFKRISRKAEESYQPKLYPGKVTLMICSDAPFRAYEDRRLGWGSVAKGGFEVHVVPGNHSTMEQEPNLQVIGEKFQRCFDRLGDSCLTGAPAPPSFAVKLSPPVFG